MKTDKFVGQSSELNLFKGRDNRGQSPPDSSVTAIKTSDENDLWIASATAVHQFDSRKQVWKLALPIGPACAPNLGFMERFGCLALSSNQVAVGLPMGGVNVCPQPGNQWRQINLAADRRANQATALRVDYTDKRLLWVGGHGKLSAVDMNAGKVIGTCDLVGLNSVLWILPSKDFVIIMASGQRSGQFGLYWLKKPSALIGQLAVK